MKTQIPIIDATQSAEPEKNPGTLNSDLCLSKLFEPMPETMTSYLERRTQI